MTRRTRLRLRHPPPSLLETLTRGPDEQSHASDRTKAIDDMQIWPVHFDIYTAFMGYQRHSPFAYMNRVKSKKCPLHVLEAQLYWVISFTMNKVVVMILV